MEYALIEHVHKKDVSILPKIIEDVERSILQEARKELIEQGPRGMTIRSVAGGCGIAIGTIYNYYPNKEMLMASVILQDWLVSMEDMKAGCQNVQDIISGLEIIYQEIQSFLKIYSQIFCETGIPVVPNYTYNDRHNLLCSQIGSILEDLYARFDKPQQHDMLIFLSECLLNGAVRNSDFSFLKNIFIKLM